MPHHQLSSYQDVPLEMLPSVALASPPSGTDTIGRLANGTHVIDDVHPTPVTGKSSQIALPIVVMVPLQEWEGYVAEIGDLDFTVALVDITRGDKHVSETAVIPLKELSQKDAADLSLGQIFRWVIGYEYSMSGEKTTVSHIVFRDLPRLTDEDMEEARKWAREYSDWLAS